MIIVNSLILNIFKPPPPVGAGGSFRVIPPCRCPCVRPSVRDSRGSFMFPRYLQYLLTDFRQTFVTGASRDRDELIRFWGQTVKGQGHCMTECIPDFDVSVISPVSVDGFSPNFCHWCISGQRWPDYVFGQKVKVQGHAIPAEAHSTRRYRRVQLFLVANLKLVDSAIRCSQGIMAQSHDGV